MTFYIWFAGFLLSIVLICCMGLASPFDLSWNFWVKLFCFKDAILDRKFGIVCEGWNVKTLFIVCVMFFKSCFRSCVIKLGVVFFVIGEIVA